MLTIAQRQALKADIALDPAFASVPHNSDGAFDVAAAYNLTAVPDWWVWKTAVTEVLVKQAIIWTEFISRSAGERDSFQFMLSTGAICPADANIRQGIADIFSGPSGLQTRTNLLDISKRKASRVEKLFSLGTGSVASPATMTFEGSLAYQDVLDAWAS